MSPALLVGWPDAAGRLVAAALAAHGVPIASRQIVDEEESAVEAALRWGVEAHGLTVILSPGGGSEGEAVRRVLARVTGSRLVLNERVLSELEAAHARRGKALPRRLERLALIPQGATLWAAEGGQIGWLLETARGAVAVLPQDPAAVSALVARHLLPFARERFSGRDAILLRILRVAGLDPGQVEERLGNWLHREAPVAVSCVGAEGEVWVRLRARGASPALAAADLGEVERQMAAALGEDCYGRDQDSLEVVVGRLLRDRGLTVSAAESCTGGLLGHRITNVPGSSAYFERGAVTYSNRAKEETLGVPGRLIALHGAVSAEVAEAMALGIRQAAGTPLGLAITGVAGPDGGSAAKPVGTVYVGLATPEGPSTRRFNFAGDREAVKWQASQAALDLLRRYLVRGPGGR